MLIPDLFTKWNISPRGIIHIGAHLCEEKDIYISEGKCSNILWIEANPEYTDKNKEVYQGLISNITGKEVDFIITNNEGQSSSFLELKEHLIEHPHVREEKRIKLKTITFQDFVKHNNIDCSKYDFLAMDIQGAELHALQGMGELLRFFKHLYIEVNTKQLYEGCGLFQDVINFLSFYNFKIKDINLTQHGWGDAYFENDDVTDTISYPNMSFLNR